MTGVSGKGKEATGPVVVGGEQEMFNDERREKEREERQLCSWH